MKKYIILAILLASVFAGVFFIKQNRGADTAFLNTDPSPTPEPVTPYTMNEVSKHSVKNDCWIVISGSVFNMTSFIDSHPGRDAILQGCGKDATTLFNSVESHNQARRDFLRTFKIGIVSTSN